MNLCGLAANLAGIESKTQASTIACVIRYSAQNLRSATCGHAPNRRQRHNCAGTLFQWLGALEICRHWLLEDLRG